MVSTSPIAASSPTIGRERTERALLVLWAGLVAAAMLWPRLWPLDQKTGVHAPPFFGSWHDHAQGWIVIALAVGAALVVVAPVIGERIDLRWLPGLFGAAAGGWVAIVASTDGWSRLAAPLSGRRQYLPFATRIRPGSFVDSFVERAHTYPTHVKGHPPGATLAFWLLDHIGLGGNGWAAVFVIAAWGIAVAAVLWATIDVAGATAARAAAPFLVLMPAVVWAGTSADALFTGVTAIGIAAVVVATGSGSSATRRIALAVFGGAVLAVALHMTYGAVPLLVIPAAVAIRRRSIAPIVAATIGGAVITSMFVAAGFWWLDGLAATRGFYVEGLAEVRPYAYFVIAGNLGALAIAVGPAWVGGWSARRGAITRHPVLLLVAAAAAAVLIADVSGMSKAEVERIWLPFMPWLALGAATLVPASRRRWLSAQLALTLLLQVALVTPW